MRLVELGLELFLVDDMSFDLHNLDSLPPSSGGTSEKVSGEKHLLFVTNFGDLQVVVDGVKPFISIKWFSALGKHMWISVLESFSLERVSSSPFLPLLLLACPVASWVRC
jgi:hypothetical protein